MTRPVTRSLVVALALLTGGALDAIPNAASASEETRLLDSFRESQRLFASGAAAARRGDTARATRSYEQAIERDPDFVEAIVNLARLHLAAERFDEARDWLEKATRARPDYPKIAATYGLLAMATGESAEAIDALSRAQRLAPEDTEVSVNLGAVLIERGRVDEARRMLEEVVRDAPDLAVAIYNLALADDLAGRVEQATYGYRRFLALSSFEDPGRESVERRLEILSGAAAVSSAPESEAGLVSEARSPQAKQGE